MNTTPAGRLVKKSGEEVNIGDVVTDRDNVQYVVQGWRRPHKVSSTGRVFVKLNVSESFEAQYFPSVFGLEIIDHEFSGAPEPVEIQDEHGNCHDAPTASTAAKCSRYKEVVSGCPGSTTNRGCNAAITVGAPPR